MGIREIAGKIKTWIFRTETLSLFVATIALVFTIAQHFRIQEFDRMLKCPILSFDVMVNRYKDTYSVSLINKGLAPATITETTFNKISHSAVSINEIRQSIFDNLQPLLNNGCTVNDIRYAGYDAGSTVAAGEKSVLFSVLKKDIKTGIESARILKHFDKNTISIHYTDISGNKIEELFYP